MSELIATNNDVSQKSKIQEQMTQISQPVRDLVGGTVVMRRRREQYLPKEPLETAANYDRRLRSSVLFNATGKTVEDLTGRVFSKPVQLEEDVPEQLVEWSENIDNAESHINVFARNVFYDSIQTGIGYIFVDAPPPPQGREGATATLADYQSTGWRPYLKYIAVEDLIGFKSQSINGKEVLTQIRIRETVAEQDPQNVFLEKDVTQIRVITLNLAVGNCSVEVYQQVAGNGNKDGGWIKVAEKDATISLPYIPLVPVYLNRVGFMQAVPPLHKLAEINIKHWQSSSDQSNIVHVARVPILFGAGVSTDDQILVGPHNIIRANNPDAKLQYVEHSGAAVKAGQDELDDLVEQMQAMGLQLLINRTGKTATGEMRDEIKETSPLAMMATALQDSLEAAFEIMAEFAGLGDGGSLVVNKDFGGFGSIADIQYLTQAAIAGKISLETYWFEMRRRDVLSDSFDPEVEKTRLDNAVPELGANVPPGRGMNLNPESDPSQENMPPE